MIKKIKLDMVKMFDGNLEVYYEWNIKNAARTIIDDATRTIYYMPEKPKLTLMIYELHKGVLKNRGFDPKKLELGDNALVIKVKEGLSKKAKARLN